MAPKQFYEANEKDRVQEVSETAGTNLDNFKQIVYGGSVGKKLAKKLEEASDGEMTVMEILFSEVA